jgi:hypothetical protein
MATTSTNDVLAHSMATTSTNDVLAHSMATTSIAVATLLAAHILLGRRCRFNRGGDTPHHSNPARTQVPLPAVRRFYALRKSCSVAGAASSGCGAPTRRLKPAHAGAASNGGDASTRP